VRNEKTGGSNELAGSRESARDRFIELLDELFIWLDETREDVFCTEIRNFSFRAAEFAAILGFDRPPCELVFLIPQQDYSKLTDIREQAVQTRVRIHPPIGWSSLDFGFTAPLSEVLFSKSDSRLHADLRVWVNRWKRAVQRIQIATAKPASTTPVHYMNSHEAMAFDEQRLREIAGDQTLFSDEMQERVSKAFRIAELNGFTPEQTSLLIGVAGRSNYDESVRRRESIAISTESGSEDATEGSQSPVTVVETRPVREPRKSLCLRAEKQVKEACAGVFPGFRELARELGCEKRLSSLNNAIKSSTYLSARKAEYDKEREAKPREQQLSDLHLDQAVQSREPEPPDTLEQLIKEQEADQRNDTRMAKPQARRRSA
jgi:hypothetical protein